MQNKGKKKPVELVHKPIIQGSWHGKDARKMAFKRGLSVIATTAVYFFGCLLTSFDALWGRVLMCFALVAGVMYYQYVNGINQGEKDAAFGEIIYGRKESGRNVPEDERERSYHPMKGVFAALAGAAPFMLAAAVYACMAETVYYQVGMLPDWVEGLMNQTEFRTGLIYYAERSGLGLTGVLRIIDRAMIMPFVNVATAISPKAVLLVERFSPLLVLLSPMGYGYGYFKGQHLRDQVNTGIKVGDERKKKREMKARKKRQRQQRAPKGPERLV